jgi:hypothetical protein
MAELIRTLDQRADLLRGEGEVRWPEGVRSRFVPDTTGSAVFVPGPDTKFVPRLGFAHIHSQPHARTPALHPGRAPKFLIKPRRGTAGMPRESAYGEPHPFEGHHLLVQIGDRGVASQ